MCSPEADTVELLIYLEEPCHVCEVLITISYGDDDSTIPGRLDIRTGRNLDALDLVVKVYFLKQLNFINKSLRILFS